MSQLFDWEGKLPEESIEDYHSRIEYYSSSNIKAMGKSPWHFKKLVIDGVSKPNASQSFGSIAHPCILEGKFDQLKVMPSKWETMADQKKRGIANPVSVEDQKAAFLAENQGFVVSEAEYEKLEGMVEAFNQDHVAQSLIDKNNIIEQGYLYWDQELDVKCRFRPDIINLEKGYMVDYKTAQSAQKEAFKWAVVRYGYHISAAHYLAGAERLFPGKVNKFYFIVQENSYPFACATFSLSSTDLMFGKNLRDRYIKKIKQHLKIDEWPGYTTEIKDIELPDSGYDMEDFFNEA